jgi:hypothetical protein
MQEPPPPLAGHAELAPVLATGLAKDIAKRYETCADFAAAAGHALAPDAVRPRAVRRPHLLRALRRPSRRQAAVAVGSTVADIAAALSLFFTLGSGGVRVTSDSLLIVDAVHGQVAADLPLGLVPGDVTTGSGLVWVLSGDGRSVTALDPATLRVIQTIDLHGNSTRQWAGGATPFGATDFVALSGTSTLDLVTKNSPGVSGVNPTAVTRITPWPPSPGDAGCAAFVTGSGTRVWFSKGRHLAEIDARTGVVLGTRLLPAGPQARTATCYGVRYTGGNLLAARSPDSSVGYLDPATGAFRSIVVSFSGLGARRGRKDAADWAAGFGSLWIDAKGTLVQVAVSTGKIVAHIPVGTGGGSVVVDPSSGVWVIDASGRSLFRINPATRRVSKRIRLGHRACCVAAGFGRIWVTLGSS